MINDRLAMAVSFMSKSQITNKEREDSTMELRVLEYFLAVAREQNFTRAAEFLHLTQPTLSRQLSELEAELGKVLFVRGKRRVTLTDDGVFLRRRAEEILSLAHRTVSEMRSSDEEVTGDICIGTGESEAIRNIIQTAGRVQHEHPGIRFHFTCGTTEDLTDRLDSGFFDFCILFGDVDQSKYDYLPLPYTDSWGLLVPDDDPIALRDSVDVSELSGMPLIAARQPLSSGKFRKWIGKDPGELDIRDTYSLIYTGKMMVEEGIGYALALRHIFSLAGTHLRFIPVVPELTMSLTIVWKKFQSRSRAAELFLGELERTVAGQGSGGE